MADSVRVGTQPFTITARVNVGGGDRSGDLVSQWDPATRTGFSLGVVNSAAPVRPCLAAGMEFMLVPAPAMLYIVEEGLGGCLEGVKRDEPRDVAQQGGGVCVCGGGGLLLASPKL